MLGTRLVSMFSAGLKLTLAFATTLFTLTLAAAFLARLELFWK